MADIVACFIGEVGKKIVAELIFKLTNSY